MFTEFFENQTQKKLSLASKEELFSHLIDFIKLKIEQNGYINSKKKLYYISAEFLLGKLLSNNLMNLGIYNEVDTELRRIGTSVSELEELENEPSLGNGGLGRLAACLMDSASSLNLCADGVGLNYHFGLFKQVFQNNMQTEQPNPWITQKSWLEKSAKSFKVKFTNFSVDSILYDIAITGFGTKSNRLRLFDIPTIDESIVRDGIYFDKENIQKNLTLFLYPDDSDEKGKLLRLYQQYFMVSCSAQLILSEAVEKGSNLYDLADYAVIQINDTHPALIIAEMIYLLEGKGIPRDTAIEITSKICAYTNHTILSEALEKWPLWCIQKVASHLVPIISSLDQKVREKHNDQSVYIIDNEQRVHMAKMAIHYGFSINGVAKLHTEILKNTELNNFYRIYPQKFNNKTNGITFRRWLEQSNPLLTTFLTSLIGDDFLTCESKIEKLMDYKDDDEVLENLIKIKNQNKHRLCEYMSKNYNVQADENSIFDIQIKRLHEYKRQQLNALYIIDRYLKAKNGDAPKNSITCIFGAKAAPSYVIAKDIIHLILCLSKLIDADPDISRHTKVIMAENYNVTSAQVLIPACDISEQISLASKEASGTGNMKFMLNGAVTLGTLDGANVEIENLVGRENIYVFGMSSDQVISSYRNNSYSPQSFMRDSTIKACIDFITSPEMLKIGNASSLMRLQNYLANNDYFMTLGDFHDYVKTKNQALTDWCDKKSWAKKSLINIAKSGFFSSDRTVSDYNRDIWKLK